MNVVIQGRQHRFIGGSLGDKPITEIWLGDKQIWPNVEGLARNIVVELPQRGSRDWQYWVHAVEATKNQAASNNYMKFQHRGVNFYIQHSIDGSEAYKLEGNTLSVDMDGVLIDQLGEYLEVDACIASREGNLFTEGESFCQLPYLSGTQLNVRWRKGQKKKSAGSSFVVSGMPGDVVHFGGSCYTSEHKRKSYLRILPENTHKWVNRVFCDEADAKEIELKINVAKYSSSSRNCSVQPVWPQFIHRFKLKIISVS